MLIKHTFGPSCSRHELAKVRSHLPLIRSSVPNPVLNLYYLMTQVIPQTSTLSTLSRSAPLTPLPQRFFRLNTFVAFLYRTAKYPSVFLSFGLTGLVTSDILCEWPRLSGFFRFRPIRLHGGCFSLAVHGWSQKRRTC